MLTSDGVPLIPVNASSKLSSVLLPSAYQLSRAIRQDKLNQSLRKRSSLESLVEKGVYKGK